MVFGLNCLNVLNFLYHFHFFRSQTCTSEDLEVWKAALANKIYGIKVLTSKDYSLRDQIRRASVSIMSNILRLLNRRLCITYMLCLA